MSFTEAQIEAAALVIINANRATYGYRIVESLDEYDIDPAEAFRARDTARAALEAAERAAWRPVSEAVSGDVFLIDLNGKSEAAYWHPAMKAFAPDGFDRRYPWVFLDSTNGVNGAESGQYGPKRARPLPQPPGEEAAR